MGLTLVSISCLTSAGYTVLFHENLSKIFNEKKMMMGEIPVDKGLYCIRGPKRPFAGVMNAKEALTMRDVHTRFSHIAPNSIKCRLKDGIITGIALDPSELTLDKCDSCEYAKATQKAIGKKFGDEVHMDLWGPSPVQTPGHKEYFVSFTDDHT
ncbi:uncharacterized protein F5147DRAFT_563770 [Suillus discolor]|uniref:Uncharacterized protein n=1 Tax=Suillus discolor TaxID=1912936 RepID=A0A9P7FIL9_9AGAM|nr:uncharacterized protein F5147DRAFT_563770 [Suillus discolor]KAG2119730.1 hypothetical protein F5147DRAFT_563770 [Suillus discolor]